MPLWSTVDCIVLSSLVYCIAAVIKVKKVSEVHGNVLVTNNALPDGKVNFSNFDNPNFSVRYTVYCTLLYSTEYSRL